MSTASDGLNSARLQQEDGTPESIMDFNNTKGFGLLGVTCEEAMDLTRDCWTGETVLPNVLLQQEEGLSDK